MDFPRHAGKYRYHVKTLREFQDFVAFNNGKEDIFWSHNSIWEDEGKPYSYVRTIPFDYDSKDDMAVSYQDCVNTAKLGEELGVPVLSVFTTNKGFHNYLCFKPIVAKRNQALRQVYKAIQLWVTQRIQAKSWDKQLLGDVMRQMRVPGTIHPKTQKWCMAFDPLSTSLPELLQACETRKPIVDFPEGRETVVEFLERAKIPLHIAKEVDYTGSSFAAYQGASSDFDIYVRAIIPRVCIHNSMMTNNPPHPVRREVALTLAQTGYDLSFAIGFMGKVSQHYDWHNRTPEIQNYHIRDLFRRAKDYRLHSCKTLRQEGLCIGKTCELFSRAFPEEVDHADT